MNTAVTLMTTFVCMAPAAAKLFAGKRESREQRLEMNAEVILDLSTNSSSVRHHCLNHLPDLQIFKSQEISLQRL